MSYPRCCGSRSDLGLVLNAWFAQLLGPTEEVVGVTKRLVLYHLLLAILMATAGGPELVGQAVRRAPDGELSAVPAKTYRLGKLRLPSAGTAQGSAFVLEESLFGPWYLVVPSDDIELAPLVNRQVVVRGWFDTLADGRTPVLVVDRAYAAVEPGLGVLGPTSALWPVGPLLAAPRISNNGPPGRNVQPIDQDNARRHNPVSHPAAERRSIETAAAGRFDGTPSKSPNDTAGSAQANRGHDDTDSRLVHKDDDVRLAQAEESSATRSRRGGAEGEETLPPPKSSSNGYGREPPLELRSRPGELYWSDQPYPQPGSDPYGVGSFQYCPGCGSPLVGGVHTCNSPERFWLHGDYLHWWTRALQLPPLVTTSAAGTPQASAGVFGVPTTSVLFGNSEVNDSDHIGWRASGGAWMGPAKRWGVDLDYFKLDDQQERFSQASDGTVILARPYFDIVSGNEAAVLIAFPAVASGSVSAEAITKLDAAAGRLRWNLCCSTNTSAAMGYPLLADGYRVDLTGGYRFARLSDHLTITHTSLDLSNEDTTFAEDLFVTGNEFHGGEVGIVWERRWGRWLLLGVGRVALGNNRQTVRIEGRSVIDNGTGPQTFTGGVLAQSSNIGFFRRDEFSVIPELGLTVGLQLTNHTRITAGYTFYYVSNVVRAGDIIDRDLNPGLLPPASGPLTGPARPQFVFHETDFWAQGLTAGVDVRF